MHGGRQIDGLATASGEAAAPLDDRCWGAFQNGSKPKSGPGKGQTADRSVIRQPKSIQRDFTPKDVSYINSDPNCAAYQVRIDTQQNRAFAIRQRL